MKKHLFTIASLTLGFFLNAQVCLNPSAGSPFSLAQQPFSITSADFNSDGKADLATADRNNSSVSILLGDGVGSFTSTTSFTVGSFPNSITNADFNADGKIDLATTNNGSSNVSILLGDGIGNFTATTSISVGSAPSSITKGDFNSDGKVDLAIANNSSNTISILLGNGLGGFAAAVNFNTGIGPISVISADFNSDSKLDLGVANATSNNVSILLGNGAGSFSTAVNFSVGTFPRSVINGDFNADGKVDLATANDQSNNVSVLIGDGNGNFATSVLYSVGTNPYSVTTGDFNSDGQADLATANVNSNNISVLLGNGTGSFATAVNIAVGSVVRSVISIDFNADGRDDLASANFISSSIFLNQTPFVIANSTATVVCAGTNITLSGAGATTYTWSGGVSDGVAFIPSATTTYTVIGTDVNGCTNSAVKNITVNPLPTVNAGPSRTLTCANTSTTLAGSTTGGVNYSWIGPGIVSGSTTLNPTINAPGTYDLTVTSAAGCSAGPLPVTVFQSTTPPSPTASSSGTITCSTLTVALTGGPASGVTYQWTGPGFSGGTTSQNAVANSAGTFTLTVTDVVNGCTNTAVTSVTQSTSTPTISANTTDNSICIGATTTISATGVGVNTYVWNPGNLSGATHILSPATTTIYTVTGTNTLTGCTAFANVTVTVNPLPTITAGPTKSLTCASSFTVVTCSSVGGISYNWTGPGIISGYTTTNCNVSAAGTYTVFAISPFGCNSTNTTVLVVSNKVPPTVSASTSGTLSCSNSTVALNGAPATGVTYQWSGPGFSSGTTAQNADANAVGTYTLKVTSSANSCTNAAVTTVTQNTITPTVTGSVNGTLTCITTTANAILSSTTTPVSYNWSGVGIISGATTPTITVNQPGIFSYTVTNTLNGCLTTGTEIVSQNTVAPLSVNAGMDQTITCATPTINLIGSVSSPTNVTFNWNGGVCGSPSSSVTTACVGGTYTLTATNPINGCTSSDAVQVNQDIAVPSVSLSTNASTITCFTPTVNVVATTTVGSVSYSWSPAAGIIGGSGSTNTPYFNAAGSYSLVVTNFINGCSTTISANVINVFTNITVPTISISASPSVICSGSSTSTTLTASSSDDPITDYTWSPGSLNGAIQNVSPLSSTLYSVVVTNTINGCASTETVNVTVNTTPTLTISGNTNICKGSSTTLTGGGATSYSWNSGANTTSISVTPSITTTYTLTGDNGNGCLSSLPITVSIIPNKTINGIITSTAGATNGDIILYKYNIGLSYWDSVTTVPFTNSYSFTDIDSAQYVLRAIPTATNIQVTYGANSISWQNATIISHGCSNNSTQNIDLIAFENFTPGPGILSGKIVEGDGFGQTMRNEFKPLAPGEPIGGIVVKGGRNPGGQMFTQTVTDAAGQYTLTGFPVNTGTESYFVFVDIPGLDTNGTYHRVISTGNSQFENLNFIVDSMYIHPVGVASAINSENTILNNSIIVYPNPASNQISIKYELINTATIKIELFDLLGQKVKDICVSNLQEKNKYSYSTNLEDLSSGVYFIKFMVNKTETSLKLIVTN